MTKLRTPELVLQDIMTLETKIFDFITQLDATDKEELDSEPAHRQMITEVMNMDVVAKLGNQTQRDNALEDYILNRPEYAEKHRTYLELKNKAKSTYRNYRFYEECLKDRRAELQMLTFGGDK